MGIGSKAFVLLHSPLVGPRTWRDVADVLEARGALVVVPSFLGVEDAAAPAWRWVADTAARAVHDVDGDAVLVAHSGAGPLAPVIADAIERRVSPASSSTPASQLSRGPPRYFPTPFALSCRPSLRTASCRRGQRGGVRVSWIS